MQPDALVLGVPRTRTTWPDLPASAVLRSAPVPVFCVPEAAQPTPAIAPVRSVLVPTDGSAATSLALSSAYGLLGAHGGRVELCMVHECGPRGETGGPSLTRPLDNQARATLEARLRELVPAQANAMGIETHVAVVEGSSAGESIRQASERLGVDMIVMASHGRSGIKRALLGSVAEEVARHSVVPVMIVHEPAAGAR